MLFSATKAAHPSDTHDLVILGYQFHNELWLCEHVGGTHC